MEAFDYLSKKRLQIHLAIPTISEPEGLAVNYNLETLEWKEIKFLDDTGENFHSQINNIPNNTGGLYMFQVKSDILPELVKYPLYIGRARNSDGNYSLRSRCKTYKNATTRPKIKRMVDTWGPHLYIYYTELSDNQLIDDLEKWLIGTILPEFNSRIDNVSIKDAVKMF
ncbi:MULTISPECIES: hypothetical protein [unclassified Exiguobacterium]|uniref:hypothetical protein n=1 Tax=unclassified Exiguobacterium TaxID=2644629 RepID=UPI001BE71CE8|nr:MULTISPECIES: hypothetical protein [unclassified Exiguobacterium]